MRGLERLAWAPISVALSCAVAALHSALALPANDLGTDYQVWASPDFVDDHAVAIAGAARDWESSTSGLRVSVQVRDCGGVLPRHVACFVPGTVARMHEMGCHVPIPVGCSKREAWRDDSFVMLDPDMDPEVFGQVARHELGHAFGLPDDREREDRTTVMGHSTGAQAPSVTCVDVGKFWQLRRRVVPCLIREPAKVDRGIEETP